MTRPTRVLVTGAGGFIGHHLVRRLKELGCWVRGADLALPAYEPTHADEERCLSGRSASVFRWRDNVDDIGAIAGVEPSRAHSTSSPGSASGSGSDSTTAPAARCCQIPTLAAEC